MDLLLDFFKNYYILIIVVIGILTLLFNNSFVSKKKEFFTRLVVVSCLVIAFLEFCEIKSSTNKDLYYLRITLSSLVYVLKPSIILCISRLILTEYKVEKKYIYVPLIVCAIVYILPFFPFARTWVFTFDDNYTFYRGPLGYTSHVTSAIYLLYVLIKSFMVTRCRKTSEGLLLLSCALFITLSVILETLDVVRFVVWPTIAVSICFYYFFLYTQISKRDALTGLLNRVSYYKDVKTRKDINAIISLDMNGLKIINDRDGHEQGDVALVYVSDVFLKNIERKHMRVYRKGGDEFTILCFGSSKEIIDLICKKMKDDFSSSPYSVSLGLAYTNECKTFEDTEILADKRMYKDKICYYESINETQHKYLAGE